jgi:hypothetical protein
MASNERFIPAKTIRRLLAQQPVDAEERVAALLALAAVEQHYVRGEFPAWSKLSEGEALDSVRYLLTGEKD